MHAYVWELRLRLKFETRVLDLKARKTLKKKDNDFKIEIRLKI